MTLTIVTAASLAYLLLAFTTYNAIPSEEAWVKAFWAALWPLLWLIAIAGRITSLILG